jgi:hypothetical protein
VDDHHHELGSVPLGAAVGVGLAVGLRVGLAVGVADAEAEADPEAEAGAEAGAEGGAEGGAEAEGVGATPEPFVIATSPLPIPKICVTFTGRCQSVRIVHTSPSGEVQAVDTP